MKKLYPGQITKDETMTKDDITTEEWREYDYGTDGVYRIENPVALFRREGGSGHRVLDKEGVVHWCPVNRHHILRWKNKDSNNPVNF